MATHPLSPRAIGRLSILAAGCALRVALCCVPVLAAPAATEEKKVWSALTEQEPRSNASPAPGSLRPARPLPAASMVALVAAGLVVAGLVLAVCTAARRSRTVSPPAAHRPEEPAEGRELEELWHLHLRGTGRGRHRRRRKSDNR